MGLDGLDGLAHRGLRVAESFEPMIEVDTALTDGIQGLVLDAARFHDVVEMRVTHMTCAALRMGHNHDLFHTQFIDGDDQAAHRRIKRRDDESACVLDNLGISVLEPERGRKKFRKARVHTGQYRQFLIGVLVGDVLLVAFLCHETLVEINNPVYHKLNYLRNLAQRYKKYLTYSA